MRATPLCPRCGYDLSGVAASWKEECPLEGVCSECGLAVRWAELLNPLLTVPPWSFEHAMRRISGARIATWRRALAPLRFWQALRMEHPVIGGRLLEFAILGVLVGHLVVFGATCWLRYEGPTWRRPNPMAVTYECLWPYTVGDSEAVFAGHPLVIDDDSVTGPMHWLVLSWFLFTPLSFLILTDTLRVVRVRLIHVARAGAYSLAVVPVVLAASALVQVVRVRFFGSAWSAPGASAAAGWMQGVLWLAAAVWLVRYWHIVPRDYLRLPQARLVSAVMIGLAGLGAFVLVLVMLVVDFRYRV